MEAITYAQIVQNFSDVIKSIGEDCTKIIITKEDTKPVVLMSLAEYDAIQQTLYLMRIPA